MKKNSSKRKTVDAAPKAISAKTAKVSENTPQIYLFFLRVVLGWVFLYAGLTKLLDPSWTAAGFLQNAQTFPDFYGWLAASGNIVWVDVLNKIGLTLIGAGLITGTLTRYAGAFGIIMMVLYYLPGLDFPYLKHSFLVDEHIVYIFALAVLIKYDAGKYWGLDAIIEK